MKKPITSAFAKVVFSILCLAPVFSACNQGKQSSKSTQRTNKAVRTSCYTAIYAKDTAYLKLKQFANGKIGGALTIIYDQKPKNEGTLQGSFSGDTLFVDYTFATSVQTAPIYKNPLAFLKKANNLILGPAIVRTYLGRSYLDKKDVINFDKGKFIFIPAPCYNQHTGKAK